MGLSKLMVHCVKEAKKDKAWAKRTAKDKEWLAMASDVSKDMLAERLAKPVKVLAKKSCDYLKHRACAKGILYGRTTFIDTSAREKYKKITGKYPICRTRVKKK